MMFMRICDYNIWHVKAGQEESVCGQFFYNSPCIEESEIISQGFLCKECSNRTLSDITARTDDLPKYIQEE